MSAPTLAEQPAQSPRFGPPESGRPRDPESKPGPWPSILAMEFAGMVILGILTYGALRTSRGMALDERLMDSVGHSAAAAMRIQDWLTYVSVAGVALALAVCVIVALSRQRYNLAAAAIVLVAGANISTRVLKKVVIERTDSMPNTLPSGHTTVAVSLGLAAVIVAPAAWRWVVVPFAGFVGTFVGAGTVVGQWHRPSDAAAAVAVCMVWSALALAVAYALQREVPPPRDRWAARSALGLVGSAMVGLCFVSWGLRPQDHDTELLLAVLALAPIGVLTGLAVFWTSAIADRRLA
ncbi:phosphatase PAP2 family protein [Demetria terragena]|uniref:phosphatase PAP2 family protein n=1 Tax=Demetria terragena TaxID=63959 RepID=UPI0014614F2C|nr:phosphatase PAP2 family protein [Demetria terragena]